MSLRWLMSALSLCLFVSFHVQADPLPYYGEEFYFQLNTQPESVIKQQLRAILATYHITQPGRFDRIVQNCPRGVNCSIQTSLGYKHAREVLFGAIHLEERSGKYHIKDVYCEQDLSEDELDGMGPMQIPDYRVINAEHTWPQSKFNPEIDKDIQKSDLNGLYPVLASANSARNNLPFGEVDVVSTRPCRNAVRGTVNGQGRTQYFEPPMEHKGNVARAMFYFSIRYQMPIDPVQEAFLREWHEIDPVDAFEMARNEAVYDYQHNRNPFIDHPDLVRDIHDF